MPTKRQNKKSAWPAWMRNQKPKTKPAAKKAKRFKLYEKKVVVYGRTAKMTTRKGAGNAGSHLSGRFKQAKRPGQRALKVTRAEKKHKAGFTCVGCNAHYLTITRLRAHIASKHPKRK